jgi:transposase
MPLTREQLPNDPEVLRAMILSLRTDLERAEQERMALADSLKQITELQADIDAGRAQSDAFPAKVARLAEQNAKLAALVQFLERERDALKHRLSVFLRNNYGRKSEKLTPGQQEIDFPGLAETLISGGATAGDLVQVVVEAAPEEEQLKPSRPIRQAAFDESLPLEDKIHDLPKPEQACDKCGQALIQIDSVDSVQIEFVPATFKRLRHRRLKYACKACGECVKLAARPEHAIMKGLPGPGLLAQTLIAKYDDHQPLNRQEEIYERHGAHVPRSTLCDWVRQSCMLLEPLTDLMRERVLMGKAINADETHVNFRLHDKGNACEDLEGDSGGSANPASKAKARLIQKGYMWVYLGDEEHPYCCFDFRENRTREGPLNFLDHKPPNLPPGLPKPPPWRGYLQCDAYKGYDEVFRAKDDQGKPLVLEVACWAHARRYFFDAQDSQDKELAKQALGAIGEFYAVERKLKEIAAQRPERGRAAPTYEQIEKFRKRRAKPLLNAFCAWLEQPRPAMLPKSPLGQAIRYARDNWIALNRYLEQGYLSIDNNSAERALRNIVLGRKNWVVAGSRRGGRWAAIAYTLIESAKRSGANVWEYLRDVLERIAETRLSLLEELLPDAWLKARATTKV